MARNRAAASGPRRLRRVVTGPPETGSDAASTPSATSSSNRASAMSWRRWWASLTSVHRSSRRSEGVVPGGSAAKSGSRSITLAITSEAVSPANARLPASIS